MQTINVSEKFIKWVKLLFANATTIIYLDESLGNSFKVERGIRQGCPLVPYLFLIVGKVFTHIIKKTVAEIRLREDITARG